MDRIFPIYCIQNFTSMFNFLTLRKTLRSLLIPITCTNLTWALLCINIGKDNVSANTYGYLVCYSFGLFKCRRRTRKTSDFRVISTLLPKDRISERLTWKLTDFFLVYFFSPFWLRLMESEEQEIPWWHAQLVKPRRSSLIPGTVTWTVTSSALIMVRSFKRRFRNFWNIIF